MTLHFYVLLYFLLVYFNFSYYGLFELHLGIIEPDRTIIIFVYGGTWGQGDDDCWQFKIMSRKLQKFLKTNEQLNDEVYDIINVDQERYNLKMKYLYIQSYQPCAPKEIR